MADDPAAEEHRRMAEEARARAIAAFPFERVEVPGDQALATWERLRTAGRGWPVVLGDDDALGALALLHIDGDPGTAVAQILAGADGIRHPDSLLAERALERQRDLAYLRDLMERAEGDTRAALQQDLLLEENEPRAPDVGPWPTEPAASVGLSVAYDILSGEPLPKVHIALIPTDDWTTVPAHLQWGAWNACPAPEYHVAALRSWRDRFGAELVGLGFDVMNLKVSRPPQTRQQALELAREQYVYCADIVEQGVETLNALAATLMASDWWYFWWD